MVWQELRARTGATAVTASLNQACQPERTTCVACTETLDCRDTLPCTEALQHRSTLQCPDGGISVLLCAMSLPAMQVHALTQINPPMHAHVWIHTWALHCTGEPTTPANTYTRYFCSEDFTSAGSELGSPPICFCSFSVDGPPGVAPGRSKLNS